MKTFHLRFIQTENKFRGKDFFQSRVYDWCKTFKKSDKSWNQTTYLSAEKLNQRRQADRCGYTNWENQRITVMEIADKLEVNILNVETLV